MPAPAEREDWTPVTVLYIPITLAPLLPPVPELPLAMPEPIPAPAAPEPPAPVEAMPDPMPPAPEVLVPAVAPEPTEPVPAPLVALPLPAPDEPTPLAPVTAIEPELWVPVELPVPAVPEGFDEPQEAARPRARRLANAHCERALTIVNLMCREVAGNPVFRRPPYVELAWSVSPVSRRVKATNVALVAE
jgi:hypothetical protein